jgi:hypothetical protein
MLPNTKWISSIMLTVDQMGIIHTLFIESLGNVTLGGLLQRECPVLNATCRISVRIAITIVDGALKNAIFPSVEKV